MQVRSKSHIRKKHSKNKKRLIIISILLLCLLSGFLYYAFSSRFQIKEVTITGTSFTKKYDVEVEVSNILSQKLWGFIPKRSPFLISKTFLKEELLRNFTPINKVDIDIQNNTMTIEIHERDATSVICTSQVACYFIDTDGFVFVEAPQFEGSAFTKISTYKESLTLGTIAIERIELEKIQGEIALFASLSLPIQHIALISDNQMDLISTTGTRFIVRRQDSLVEIEERLRALIGSREDIGSGLYDYADLRIDSKIFLKKKES